MKKETGKKVRLLCRVLFACYILLLIYLMFFSEEWGRSILGGDYRYNLVPFREIRRYLKYRGTIGSWRVFLNLAGNVVGFMPFGALLPALKEKAAGFWRTALFSLELSLFIELSQLVLQAGSCDVDDLMLNTLGGCLGYALHRLVVSGGKHEKEKN